MDTKTALTKTLLEQLGMDVNDNEVHKYRKVFWQNPRKKDENGLRLTDAGMLAFERADIKGYPIRFPKDTEWTSKLVIWLDKFIDCPYYIGVKEIVVFSEKMAIQLVLFSGDLQKFGLAKARSVANKQQQEREKVLDKTA